MFLVEEDLQKYIEIKKNMENMPVGLFGQMS